MSVNEPFADFFNYLITNFKNKTTYVTNPDNIIIGETVDIAGKPDTYFPRLEVLVDKLKFDGYIDQEQIKQGFRFTVVGIFRRESNDVVAQDMFNLMGFARETIKIVNQANTDRRTGETICDGFIQIDGYPEIFMDHEMFPKTSTFVLAAEADIELSDTYTNN